MNRYVHNQTDQLLSAGEKIGTFLTFPALRLNVNHRGRGWNNGGCEF